MNNENILIIGGTGSLGYKLTDFYIKNNNIFIYSRDEYKQSIMKKKYSNINFILGDIRDKEKIKQTLLRYNFNIIIIMSALKHIDICEYETNECIHTNILGIQNVLNEIEYNKSMLNNLKTVCFISTDKACNPINIYGLSKAISEKLIIEKSKYIKNIKFVTVRYGNVLNSRGSILPILKDIGEDNNKKHFILTNKNMTRFIMTLKNSVDLINYAILKGNTGEIIIPKIVSCKIYDLLNIFSEEYKKPIKIGCIRHGEKLFESLINTSESLRLIQKNNYYHIIPSYKDIYNFDDIREYSSNNNLLNKIELYNYLIKNNFINKKIDKLFLINNKFNNIPFPYLIQDNILDEKLAYRIQEEIINSDVDKWDRYENPFESKFTWKNKNNLPEFTNKLFTYLSSIYFMNHLRNLVNIELQNDVNKNWWGIHKFKNGDKLDIHLDAGYHPINNKKKYLTLGIYLSKDWKEENQGYLELWEGYNIYDKNYNNKKLIKCKEKILPKFNRLILFINTDNSWHGAPEPCIINNNEHRIFLTISYLIDSENIKNTNLNNLQNKYKKAYFINRPNDIIDAEKEKLKKLRLDPEKCKQIYNCNLK